MLQHCVVRGLSCASRGALRTHGAPRVLLGSRYVAPRRRDLSAQVDVSDVEAGREVNAKVTKLADEILELNLLEISDLSNILKERLGLDAIPMGGMMPMAAAPAAAAGETAAEEPVVEEKTSFDIKLESFDAATKIKVIKEIRTITELGLKDAKAMVEQAPVMVKENVDKKTAEEIKQQLEGGLTSHLSDAAFDAGAVPLAGGVVVLE